MKENVQYCPVALHVQVNAEDGDLGDPEVTNYLKIAHRDESSSSVSMNLTVYI
jgi:hypothetical protein